jgi:hypothetical protein
MTSTLAGGTLPAAVTWPVKKRRWRLDHRAVAGDVGHGRKRVHLLGARDARHHVHRDGGDALLFSLLQQRLVLARIEEGNQRLAFLQALQFRLGGLAHLDHDVDRLDQIGGGFGKRHTRFHSRRR